MIGSFCDGSDSNIITSADSSLYVVCTSTSSSNIFKANWEKVECIVNSSSNGYWVFGNTAGSPSGFILEQFDNPSCPHAAQNWQYYNMDDGMFVSDEPMSVDCAFSK